MKDTRFARFLRHTLQGVASCALLAVVAIFGKGLIDHAAYIPPIDLIGGAVACLVLGASALFIGLREA